MLDVTKPVNLASAEFSANKFTYLEQMREAGPVRQDRISVLKVYSITGYADCAALLKDPRILRNRATATGGGRRFPFPLPKSISLLAENMINEDDPTHRRLRDLVRHAFKPQAIAQLESQIDSFSHELLDVMDQQQQVELQSQYALQIPTRMIAGMLGLDSAEMPRFQKSLKVLTQGLSGWSIVRTLLFDMPASIAFVRELVAAKREQPADDILSGLIQAESDGDRLREDEIVGMVFLLIIAGYETTVHLITNGMLTLLQNPEQLEQLRADPGLMGSAVEEILRHRGPIQSTKPGYAIEDIEIQGTLIPRGKPIMPLFGAANHDPNAFDNPQRFDITRTPNHHLGFGHGVHYCLGAHLARAETAIGLRNLIRRFPKLALATPVQALRLQSLPGWHRYHELPLTLK